MTSRISFLSFSCASNNSKLHHSPHPHPPRIWTFKDWFVLISYFLGQNSFKCPTQANLFEGFFLLWSTNVVESSKVTHSFLVLLLGDSLVCIKLRCETFRSMPFAHETYPVPLDSSMLKLKRMHSSLQSLHFSFILPTQGRLTLPIPERASWSTICIFHNCS